MPLPSPPPRSAAEELVLSLDLPDLSKGERVTLYREMYKIFSLPAWKSMQRYLARERDRNGQTLYRLEGATDEYRFRLAGQMVALDFIAMKLPKIVEDRLADMAQERSGEDATKEY